MSPEAEIWIGLAEVVPLEGCLRLEDSKGAFVNVVAWAKSEVEFRSKIGKAAAELELKLVELGDCEPFSKRHAQWEVDDEILRMVDTVDEKPDDIAFGTFHLWKQPDA